MLSSKMSHTKLSQKGITKIKFGFFKKKKKVKKFDCEGENRNRMEPKGK